ncbi:ROK family protein [Enterococcus sp.]|uniref:ROK family protein n=1 Tax=unclassified Enterococcus TaxID=2608891 RepID=UPI0028AC3FE7|nr:ROK family protein [Enterococcus sp.]
MKRYGSIEAGGTKFVCAVGDENFSVIDKKVIPTRNPERTMEQVKQFFLEQSVDAIGVGTFGPVDIDPLSTAYGEILASPKKEWRGFNLIQSINCWFDKPVYFTTDVNASAYGEYAMGGAKNAKSCAYITVGTGIGAGVIQNDHFIGGLTHLEIGHGYVKQHESDREFLGVCPYHGANCFEGVASGPSIKGRIGISGEELSLTHSVWELEGYYLAQLAYNIRVNFAPEKIIFGGGVMNPHLVECIKKQFVEINAGYVNTPILDDYVVVSEFAENASATVGNFALAKRELNRNR